MHQQRQQQLFPGQRLLQSVARQLSASPYIMFGTGVYLVFYLGWISLSLPQTAVVSLITNVFPLPVTLLGCRIAWQVASLPATDRASRLAWRLLAVSHFVATLADLGYTVLAFAPWGFNGSEPSWLDAVYFLQYGLLIGGLLMFALPSLDAAERITFWLDVGIVVVGSSLVIWAVVLLPILLIGYENALQAALALAYPLCDALMLFAIVTLALRRYTTMTQASLAVLLIGILINALGDLTYSRLSLQDAYVSGSWPELCWMLFYGCAVWSAQIQYTSVVRQQPLPVKRVWVWLPYLAIGGGYAVLLAVSQPLWFTPVGIAIFGVVGLTSLVVARQIVFVRADREAQRRALLAATALDRANTDLERQRIELALTRSEAHRYALVRALPDTILRMSSDGTIVDHHATTHSGVDVTLQDGNRALVSAILPEPVAQQLYSQMRQTLATRTLQTIEYAYANGDDLRVIESRAVVCGDEEVMIILRDVSDRSKVDRLKNEFVSIVSHELRTPLTSIRGALGLIVGGVSGSVPLPMQPMLDIALNNTQRLMRLINDILDIQKMESGMIMLYPEPYPISALVQQAIYDNQAYAEQFNVAFSFVHTLEGPQIYVDRDRFLQIVTNLLANAAKFSPPHSTVDISIAQVAGGVQLAIRDDGPGIPLAFHSQIFQKFAQADGSDTRHKTGSGLGLSIAKALTEQCSGNIWFTTELGRGTTFFVLLPEYSPGLTIPDPALA